MKIWTDLFHRGDSDGTGKDGVEFVLVDERGVAGCTVEMGHHGKGMDPGIGSAGPVQINRPVVEHPQCSLNLPLDGIRIFLPLPAGEPGPIKGDDKLYVAHVPEWTMSKRKGSNRQPVTPLISNTMEPGPVNRNGQYYINV